MRGRAALLGLLMALLLPVMVDAECQLAWEPSPTPGVAEYRMYVSLSRDDVANRIATYYVVAGNTSVPCTTISMDVGDYAGVSAWVPDPIDSSGGNESPLSNIVQRTDVVAPEDVKVQHLVILQ